MTEKKLWVPSGDEEERASQNVQKSDKNKQLPQCVAQFCSLVMETREGALTSSQSMCIVS